MVCAYNVVHSVDSEGSSEKLELVTVVVGWQTMIRVARRRCSPLGLDKKDDGELRSVLSVCARVGENRHQKNLARWIAGAFFEISSWLFSANEVQLSESSRIER
jgi:hypothetical protein